MDYDLERDLMDKGESYQDKKVRKELIANLRKEMETWEVDFTKPAEKKVYDAVIVLFDSAEEIEIFNKKAIYLYLREITGMNTKQVVTQLNKMRKKYREFRDDWDDGKQRHPTPYQHEQHLNKLLTAKVDHGIDCCQEYDR